MDGSTTRKYGATGMGLAMCGRLVRLMDGRIWLDSNVKTGSRFCFTVRVGVPENSAPERPLPSDAERRDWIKGKRVLVAEDNRVNQMVASRLLEKYGFQALGAHSGRAALEMLQFERVDLVLMDVQMPDIDGLEATRRIREMEKKTGAHLPILAMTANAMQGDRDKCLSAGMDGYLAKPVQGDQLYQAIESLLAPKALS
jgi:CheY-like chemotaxis protein